MRHALYLAPFGPLADPRRLVDVARAAEDHGWDGLFLWDHVLRRDAADVADPWIALAAVATATRRLRIGPMVTPIVRRRPIVLVRQAITLDHLSDGRLTLGLGLGVDSSGELSRFGEVVDVHERGAILDEGADLLAALFSGEPVDHEGPHFTVRRVTIEPRPVQRPRPPMWFAASARARGRPVRRAARFDGIFPLDPNAERLDEILATVESVRGSLDGFDVVLRIGPDEEPPAFAPGRATWLLRAWPALADVDDVLERIAAGPER